MKFVNEEVFLLSVTVLSMSSSHLSLLSYQTYQGLLTKTDERMAKDQWRMVFTSNRGEELFTKIGLDVDISPVCF